MSNILLASILLLNLVVLLVFLVALRRVQRVYHDFVTFITPTGEDAASPLAKFIEASAGAVGRGVAASLKATFMGQASGKARAENAIQGELAMGEVQAVNPAIAQVLASGALGKTLKRNPGLIDLALPFIAKLGNKSNGGILADFSAAPSNGSAPRPKFKL